MEISKPREMRFVQPNQLRMETNVHSCAHRTLAMKKKVECVGIPYTDKRKNSVLNYFLPSIKICQTWFVRRFGEKNREVQQTSDRRERSGGPGDICVIKQEDAFSQVRTASHYLISAENYLSISV